jgi:putative copper resistance protein D
VRPIGAAFALLWLSLALPGLAVAHGTVEAPTGPADILLAWTFDPLPVLGAVVAGWAYWAGVRIVRRQHSRTPVPGWRVWCWFLGLAVGLVAVLSPIGTYDTTFFSVHMVQHLLLTVVCAPLLALGAPITLLLRVSSPVVRKRVLLRILHSWPVRVVAHPIVAWVVFAGVMYVSHFSPLFDAALEDEGLHVFEHGLYLAAALLFWWPVVGADPSPWRLPHPMRVAYVFLGMPWSSFLGLAIFSAPAVLYRHYETVARAWGPAPIVDQQLAGGMMWVLGDGAFLVAMLLAVWVWLRAEEREGHRVDAKLEREAAAGRAAERGATPAAERQPTHGSEAVRSRETASR